MLNPPIKAIHCRTKRPLRIYGTTPDGMILIAYSDTNKADVALWSDLEIPPEPEIVAVAAPSLPADVTLQWNGIPQLPKPHRVAQAGGQDLGVLVGYVTEWGLFRVTDGAKKGAVYGCLYRAEPVERLVLGEPTPDRDVWVRTCIDEVTPHNIHTADGGRFRRSEWGPDRFAPVAKSTASMSPSSSAAVGEDDIPF